MKRIAALVATGTMLVSVPAASAKSTTYTGDIKNGGTIELTVKTTKKKGKKKTTLTEFAFEGLPVVCGGGAGGGTTSGRITFKTPVKRKKFEIDAIIGKPQNPESALEATGKVGKSSASGTIRVHGSKVPLDNGAGSGDCDGKSDWSATK